MPGEIVSAVEKALESKKKFNQSVDIAVNLKNVDMSNPSNRIDEEVVLPNDRGKESTIAVFASGEVAMKAKGAADLVIQPDEIEGLAEDNKKAKKMADEHDFFLAEAPLMPIIGKRLGTILGPRGKMPKPLPPNVEVESLIKRLRKTVRMRSRDKPTIHCPIGRADMNIEKIAENIEAVLKRLETKLERGKMNILSVYVKTTMGQAIKIQQ